MDDPILVPSAPETDTDLLNEMVSAADAGSVEPAIQVADNRPSEDEKAPPKTPASQSGGGGKGPGFQAPKKKNPWVRRGFALTAGVALVAGIAVVVQNQGSSAPAVGYISAKAQKYEMTVTVAGPGTIQPNDSYRATALVRGEILSAPFEEGQAVSKDDILFTIDAGDAEDAVKQAAIALEQAKDGVARAQTGVDQADASIKQADVGIRQADVTIAQADDSIAQAGVTVRQADASIKQADASVDQAQAGVDQAQSGIVQAQAGVEQANASVTQAQAGVEQAAAGMVQAEANVAQAEAGMVQAQSSVTQAEAGVVQAQSSVTQAEAGVVQAKSTVTQAEAGVIQAKASMEQAQAGVDQADVAVRQAEAGIAQANDTVAQAEAGVTQAEAGVTQAELSVRSAQLSYDNLVRDREENRLDRQVKANASGVVSKIYVDPGDDLAAGTPIADILDRDQMKLVLPFHSVDVDSFSVGQPATVSVSGTAEQLTGTISELSPVSTTGAGGTSVRQVTIVLRNPGALSNNMTASAMVGEVASASMGTFQYNASEQLVALYSGKLENLSIEEGSRVSDGDVVGMFEEPTSFQDQISAAAINLENAQAGLKTANASLDTAKISLQDAKIAQENAQLSLESAQAGKDNALASQQSAQASLSSAQASLDNAQAGMNTAQANLDAAKSSVSSAQASLDTAKSGVSSAQASLDTAQSGVSSSQASLDSAQASLDSAQAGRDSAQASLSSAQAGRDSAIASHSSAQAGRDNAVASRENAILSQSTARSNKDNAQISKENAQISKENAEIAKESALTSLQDAQLSQENAENNLKSAQDALEDYIITSPIDGIVIEKNYKEGDNFDPANPPAGTSAYMAVIYDMSRLTFDIEVDELDAIKVQVGQSVVITADALDGLSFTGVVDKVNINGTTVNGKTTYPVTVLVDGDGQELANQGLWPGMNVSANIIVEQTGSILTVPVDAVSRGNTVLVAGDGALDRNGVLVDPSKLHKRTVKLGRNNDDYIEVLSGLMEGETVYIENSSSSMMSAMMSLGG